MLSWINDHLLLWLLGGGAGALIVLVKRLWSLYRTIIVTAALSDIRERENTALLAEITSLGSRADRLQAIIEDLSKELEKSSLPTTTSPENSSESESTDKPSD